MLFCKLLFSISSSTKVGVNTERVLDGYDFHTWSRPFLPWAKIHYTYFDWDADKLSPVMEVTYH